MVKETRDVVVLVARIANGFAKAAEDGKFTIGDALAFGPALAAIPAAIGGAGDILSEIQNANDADKELLYDTFTTEFSISNAMAEIWVERTLEVIVNFWKLLNSMKPVA